MADKQEIIRRLLDGEKPSEIAKAMEVTQAYISKVKKEFKKAAPQPEPPKPLTYADEALGTFNSGVTAPGHTDLMISPEAIDAALEEPETDRLLRVAAEIEKLSPQDMESIHYGIVEMGNPPSEVGPAYGISPEAAVHVIGIVSTRKGAVQ